jgi:hypothetical protein
VYSPVPQAVTASPEASAVFVSPLGRVFPLGPSDGNNPRRYAQLLADVARTTSAAHERIDAYLKAEALLEGEAVLARALALQARFS